MASSSTLRRKSEEQGKLLSKSGVLDMAWSKITTLGFPVSGLGIKDYQEGIYTILVFAAPSYRLDAAASTLMSGSEDQNPFHFLCSEKIPSFSLHTPAYQLFDSVRKDLNLIHLKSELIELLKSKKQVIITGAALGGSVASLFTLWLLKEVKPKFKRPLCITFGSPLIGDASLQQNLDNSLWNSCFLHVADAAQTPVNARFKPFGTFLICVGSRCICIDDPETVMELLGGANGDELVLRDYGEVLGRLVQPLAIDTILMIDEDVINRMVERAENKKPRYDPLKKLNNMKINMIHIEKYKKKSKKENIGYYDKYKTQYVFPYEVNRVELNAYWKELVEEAEKMPQSENALLKTRSLRSGHNYRRLVEPLDIAKYYLDGGKEYRNSRPRHYVMLEKWFEADAKEQASIPGRDQAEMNRSPVSDLSDLLTFDSCFWADVEEAMRVTNALRTQVVGRQELPEELINFEKKVGEMITKREVSPEIFLEGSSFMKWCREYIKIKGSSSEFTRFMINGEYKRYGQAY